METNSTRLMKCVQPEEHLLKYLMFRIKSSASYRALNVDSQNCISAQQAHLAMLLTFLQIRPKKQDLRPRTID